MDTNKLKVYTDGYDSHSFRAYHYWPTRITDVFQATTERCFEVNGLSFKEGDIINHDGTKYSAIEFYNKFKEIQ